MTTYTFIGSAKNQSVSWDDPTVWDVGAFPDSPTADVVFPEITTSDGSIYTSFVSIFSGQSFTANSVSITDNDLELEGTLSVTNAVDVKAGGEIDMSGANPSGGILNAGSLTVESAVEPGNGQIQGAGQINVSGTVTNDATIVGGGLSLSAAALDNVGALIASGNFTVTVNSGGFSNLSGSTLTGGTYAAIGANGAGLLDLNVGALITTDAANIHLENGSDIQCFDPVGGQYVSLQTSLTTIAQNGTLSLDNQTFNSSGLTDDGSLILAGATVNMPQLTIGSLGLVSGAGTIGAAVSNSGVISAGFMPGEIVIPGTPLPENNVLEITGAVSGNGALVIGAPYRFNNTVVPATLQLDGLDSNNVVFNDSNDGGGTLLLNDLSGFTGSIGFTGTIGPGSAGDIIVPNVKFSSVTGYSYTGTSPDGGKLTIQEGGNTITLQFIGAFVTPDFTLSAGPQPISSSPPSLEISVNPTASPPPPHYWYPFDPGPSPGSSSFMASDPGPSSFRASDPGSSSFMASDPGPSSFMASDPGSSSFMTSDPGPSSFSASDPGPSSGASQFMVSDPGPSSLVAQDPGPLWIADSSNTTAAWLTTYAGLPQPADVTLNDALQEFAPSMGSYGAGAALDASSPTAGPGPNDAMSGLAAGLLHPMG